MAIDGLISDFGGMLYALAADARTTSLDGDAFANGRAMGLYEAVSLLAQQADSFGISRAAVGLAGVDVDGELL